MADCKLYDICGRTAQKAGYCEPHYRRYLKYGDASAGRMFKGIRGNKTCTAKDCLNLVESSGLCGPHYYRKARYGDPDGGLPLPSQACECGTPLEGRRLTCDECKKTQQQLYYQANKEEVVTRINRWRILRKYGEEGFQLEDRRLAGDPCDVCGRRIEPMAIDHCHDTGQVRGLLCKPCNFALGCADDDPARLRALADYLDSSRQGDYDAHRVA